MKMPDLIELNGNVLKIVDKNMLIHNFFSTQILMTKWLPQDDENHSLYDYILDLEKNSMQVKKSNIGGYQSDQLSLEHSIPALESLSTWVKAIATKYMSSVYSSDLTENSYTIHGWANINRAGDINLTHCHGTALCSAVYYVSVPDLVDEYGKLVLEDPRPFNHFNKPEMISPYEGLLVLFPGWLKHSVNPFKGSGERISIAFNFNLNISVVRPTEMP